MKSDNAATVGLRHGLSHPIALLSLLGLVVNDWYLKAAHPSFLTGKLSDVCWLVVAPLVVAALLTRTHLPNRLIRLVAVLGVGTAFVLLQVWPPLGDTWVAWTGGTHTPDPTDLFTLPALALVPLAWTRKRRGYRLILPVAMVFTVATSERHDCDWDKRYPCDGATSWDPSVPLALVITQSDVHIETYAFQRAVTLTDPSGVELDLTIVGNRFSVSICPVEDLELNETYTWTVGPFETDDHNSTSGDINFALGGTWTFTTAAERDVEASSRSCLSRAEDVEYDTCDSEISLISAIDPECHERWLIDTGEDTGELESEGEQ